MKVFLGSDHAGYELKEAIKKHLQKKGYAAKDFGCFSTQSCDYPDFIIPACEAAVKGDGRAIVFGGSGSGECIAANKVKGVRAVVPYSEKTAQLARDHNDANVLSLGGRTMSAAKAKKYVDIFLSTPFSGDERHVRRLGKIAKYEQGR